MTKVVDVRGALGRVLALPGEKGDVAFTRPS